MVAPLMYSWLLLCSTARGFSTRLSLVGPTEVKARKSFLFNEGSLKFENKEHLFDFVVTLYYQKFEDEKIIGLIVRI